VRTANPVMGFYVFGVMTTILVVSAPSGRAQFVNTCEEGTPFTAQMAQQMVSSTNGVERKQVLAGFMARDSSGRLYSEFRVIAIESPKTQTEAKDGSGIKSGDGNMPDTGRTVSISDCQHGEGIAIYPDVKLARVTKVAIGVRTARKNGDSLFELLTRGPHPPNVSVEDLGFKEIGGVSTHGYKETIFGTEKDGEWNGKALYVTESWVSDNFAEIIAQVDTQLKQKVETKITLNDIKRQEPDRSLFEIPAGYKVEGR
jgi:hypothetical protein